MEQSVKLLNDEECKGIIKRLGRELCVRPRLITERLLNDKDKDDMRRGDLSIESLKASIIVWKRYGMPDVAHGKVIPMSHEIL